MKTKEKNELDPVVRRCVEDAGSMTQSLGVGRVLGQIYSYLFLSARPRNLADLQQVLGISKGSASTGVRQLEQWGAVRKVWIKGDRKDYYEANEWVGRVIRNAVSETVGKKLAAYATLLDELESQIPDEKNGNGDRAFVRQRLQSLRTFQQKAQQVWNSPLVKLLLK